MAKRKRKVSSNVPDSLYEDEEFEFSEEEITGEESDFEEPKKGKRAKEKPSSSSSGNGVATRNPVKKVEGGEKVKTKARLEAEAEVLDRPPAVNSDYVPVPWKGRLGFACLNTYLRSSNPSVFCSRTCRIDTILKCGSSGQAHIESLGLANAWDLCKLIKWNEKYGIKFLRISSGMFPFASHAKYGYSLDFAKEPLAEAGRLAMGYGHRLTTHPGQFTQLGSPRKGVVEASIRDLNYHSQLLSLLGLRDQADRDAVMVLHMGGVFEGKAETLARFQKNYIKLSDNVKARLVLENDDVAWTVHDLLPICQELNIPLVLDYHHHNIRHSNTVREGNMDLLPLFPVIRETWTRKRITQKQHYSEPLKGAITDRDRRKHAPRVSALPPCDDTMDLMIEAKDKEQAVFELYRKYNIGPKDLFNEVIPHQRSDECKPKIVKRKKGIEEVLSEEVIVPEGEVGMGGPERRVYWPQGKEEWLSPQKRIRPKKGPAVENPEANRKAMEETATKPPKMSRRPVFKEESEAVEEEVKVSVIESRTKVEVRVNTTQKEAATVKAPTTKQKEKVPEGEGVTEAEVLETRRSSRRRVLIVR